MFGTRRMVIVGMTSVTLFASSFEAHAVGALAVGACGVYGGAWNYSDEVLAHGAAITSCPNADCQVVATLSNNCAAVAVGGGCAWAWVVREDSAVARAAAIGNCIENGGSPDCRLEGWFCDGSAQ